MHECVLYVFEFVKTASGLCAASMSMIRWFVDPSLFRDAVLTSRSVSVCVYFLSLYV